jgi:hypothetical protein
MAKYNLVLFCKSYRGDLDRITTLKKSVDKFNADKIPFVVCCPTSDMDLFTKTLKSGKEDYDFILVTDEEVLKANNLDAAAIQSWKSQQIIKLGFYKLGLCDHYAIYDSDCYFIADFHIDDFMYDKNTPYLFMTEILSPTTNHLFIKNYFKRHGRTYDFVHMSQVFSSDVLKDMEKNFLQKNNLTFPDLIDMYPYEFNWYGEYLLKSEIHEIIPATPKLRRYDYQEDYVLDRHRGIRIKDLVSMGYNGLIMQSGWLNRKIYRDPWYGKFARIKRNVFFKIHSGHKPGIFRKLLLIFYKIPVWTIKEIFRD